MDLSHKIYSFAHRIHATSVLTVAKNDLSLINYHCKTSLPKQ